MPFGNARGQGFNSAPVSFFEAGNTIINSAGIFVYSPSPGPGNLIWSATAGALTDGFGNAVPDKGEISYVISGLIGYAYQVYPGGTNVWYSTAGYGGPWTKGGTQFGNLNTITIYPTGDITGVQDTRNLLLGNQFQLITAAPGKFYIASQIPLAKNSWLMGSGLATQFISVNPLTLPMFRFENLESGISNFQVYGGTNTVGSNPNCGLAQVDPGAIRCSIVDVDMNYINGYVVQTSSNSPLHLRIRGLRGTDNAGGILIGAGATTPAQVAIEDIDLQNTTGPVISLQNVTDIAVSKVNGYSNSGNAVQVLGSCQSVFMSMLDIAGFNHTTQNTVPVMLVDQIGGAGPSPTEISVSDSVIQQGGIGVQVNGGASRLRFTSVLAKANGGDGWQWNGNGTLNVMESCGGNTNNQKGSGGYDIDVTGSVHLANGKFQYASGGVTAGRFLAAGNNYSEINPPASITTAGAAPGGW